MFKFKVDNEISLCLISPLYADRMFELIEIDRDYLSAWLSWPTYTQKASDYENFTRFALKEYADGNALPCLIEYNGLLVGAAGFNTIDKNLKVAKIGYWLCSSYQGKGVMTRVCKKLIDLAFTEFQLDKVQLSAAEENMPSRRVAERLGMKLEGIITNAEVLNGRIVDHAVYGLHK